MFFLSEPSEAESFTDETSRKSQNKAMGRVSIHGQFGRYDSLHWLKELRSYYPDVQGELKSTRVAETYDRMPWTLRRIVSPGIRRVRIHVVDTFAYEAESKQLIREIYKKQTGYQIATHRAKENDEFAKFLLKRMEDFVAEAILLDSPAQRLERNIKRQRNSGYGYGMYAPELRRQQLSVDLKPFRKKSKSQIGVAAAWVSKSGSVFSDALERTGYGFRGEHETRQLVSEILYKSHAFDEGDDASIEWLEEQREFFTSYQACGWLNPRPFYGKVDSRFSERIQAADIAAGIAERIYDKYHIPGLLDQFDYITFNGERLTESNHSDRIERWRRIAEREQKIQAFLDNA